MSGRRRPCCAPGPCIGLPGLRAPGSLALRWCRRVFWAQKQPGGKQSAASGHPVPPAADKAPGRACWLVLAALGGKVGSCTLGSVRGSGVFLGVICSCSGCPQQLTRVGSGVEGRTRSRTDPAILSQIDVVQASTPPPQVHPGPGVLMEAGGLAAGGAQVSGMLSGRRWGAWT